MILGFKDKRTAAFARGERIAAFQNIADAGVRRLRILEAATSLQDLRALPSNHLEALKGDRQGQYSIRINDQWRICFRWNKGSVGPSDVEIADYL